MGAFDKKMLLTFYRFGQTKTGVGKFFAAISKISTWLFAFVYAASFAFLFAQKSMSAAFFAVVPAAAYSLAFLLRKVIKRKRPFPALGSDIKKKAWSFPSNHAVCASIIAFGCFYVNFAFGAAMFFLAVLTGLSRVFTGAHYPLDVAAGFVLSGIVAVVGYSFLPLLFM